MRFHTHAQVPWNALSFLFFNSFKMFYESIRNAAPTARDTMVLSAMGGLLAGIIMTPVDVVKTRLMLQVSARVHTLRLICLQSVSVGAAARTSALARLQAQETRTSATQAARRAQRSPLAGGVAVWCRPLLVHDRLLVL